MTEHASLHCLARIYNTLFLLHSLVYSLRSKLIFPAEHFRCFYRIHYITWTLFAFERVIHIPFCNRKHLPLVECVSFLILCSLLLLLSSAFYISLSLLLFLFRSFALLLFLTLYLSVSMSHTLFFFNALSLSSLIWSSTIISTTLNLCSFLVGFVNINTWKQRI